MTAWQREGAMMHCPDHGQTFDPSEATCTGCRDDPRIDVIDEIEAFDVEPPEGCLSSEDLERWFVTLAKAARRSASRVARGSSKESDFHDEAAIAKHRDVAIKAMRAAAEIARSREERAYVDAREKRIQARALRAAARQ